MSKKKKPLSGLRFQPLWALLAFVGLVGVAMGTTYTNYDTLSKRFPELICLGVCVSITLSFLLPMFLKKIPITIRVCLVFMMFVSASLAINTFAAKEIVDAEERLKNDKEYQRLNKEWTHYSGQIYLEQKTVLQQSSPMVRYEEGARKARETKERLIAKRDSIGLLMKARLDTLNAKGSVTQEAYVETWYTVSSNVPLPYFNRLTRAFWAVFSTILFAYICDTAIPIFCYILNNILGDRVLIENRNRFSNGSVNKGNRSVFRRFGSAFSGAFSKRNRRKHGGRAISGEKFNGIQAIIRVKEEHPDWTYERIGEQAAREIGRRYSNGKIKPFRKGWICAVLNRKY